MEGVQGCASFPDSKALDCFLTLNFYLVSCSVLRAFMIFPGWKISHSASTAHAAVFQILQQQLLVSWQYGLARAVLADFEISGPGNIMTAKR